MILKYLQFTIYYKQIILSNMKIIIGIYNLQTNFANMEIVIGLQFTVYKLFLPIKK